MKNIEQLERELEEAKQRLDPKCWKGKHKEGTKMKGGIRVNNCVPNESVDEDYDNMNVTTTDRSYEKDGKFGSVYRSDSIAKDPKTGKRQSMVQWDVKDPTTGKSYTGTNYIDPEGNADTQTNYDQISEDWNKVNHHDKTNGLSQKAVNAYRREHPGSKLQTAVTTKPSKLKAGSKAAKRRKSFCARMSGNKGPMKKPNGKPTPKALALRRWNCESIEEMKQLIEYAEREIAKEKMLAEKWTQKYKNSINCSNPKGFSQKAHCAGKKK